MDIYLSSLVLGGAGLAVMAFSGLARHGHGQGGGHHGHAGHAHAGHAHAGPAHAGPAHVTHVAHAGHGHQGHAAHAHPGSHGAPHAHGGDWARSALWAIASPRVVFSALLGFGATGLLARPALGGVVLLALAVLGGVVFERFVVTPLWNFLLRFASAPARTLESTLLDEARAASGFDANGEGLVAVEVDGQVVQVLGRLRAEDHAMGLRVRAGDRLRVEDVDAARNRCTVSYLGR